MPKISIFIRLHSNKNYLKETMKSITIQTFEDIECFICVDRSQVINDEIIACKKNKYTTQILHHSDNYVANYNEAIKRATGDYCLFLSEGDVLVDQQVLKNFYENYLKHGKFDLYYGNLYGSADNIKRCYPDDLKFSDFLNNEIYLQSFFVKKDLFSKSFCFNPNLEFLAGKELIMKALFLMMASAQYIDLDISKINFSSPSKDELQKINIELNMILNENFHRFADDYKNLRIINNSKLLNLFNSLRNNKIISFLYLLITGKATAKIIKFYHTIIWTFHKSKYAEDYRKIPVIINNFNRYTYLLRLIRTLECRGISNIFIIDNASTYPPLLDYYKFCPHEVYRLEQNIGYRALWETSIFEKFKNDYYVYTDPDVEIIDECPTDFMNKLIEILKKYKFKWKVGLAIKIDDLPDCFENKKKVINWERNHYKNHIGDNLFDAPVDTTFALYKPYFVEDIMDSIRIGYPYLIRHLPWYENTSNLPEEEIYYSMQCKQSTLWTKKTKNKLYEQV